MQDSHDSRHVKPRVIKRYASFRPEASGYPEKINPGIKKKIIK